MDVSQQATQPIAIGRKINGISLNPLEFLLDGPGGDYWTFQDKPAAYAFIRDNIFPEATDEEIEDAFSFMTISEVEQYTKDNAQAIGEHLEEETHNDL